MSRVSVDTSELRELSADLRSAPSSIAPKVNAVVFKGAMNIKAAMVSDMSASRSFRGVARDIDFDMIDGQDSVAAEIGPRSAPGAAGNLANIAYFGSPTRAGGATVRDPREALEDEQPKFEQALADVLGEIL